MAINYYLPTISKPTRIQNESSTLIDNIFVNSLEHVFSGIFAWDLSDHLPVYVIRKQYFHAARFAPSGRTISFRCIYDSNIEKMCELLSLIDFDHFTRVEDINLAFTKLYDIIFKIYCETCPIKTKHITQKQLKNPWIGHHLKGLIRRRHINFLLVKQNTITNIFLNYFRNRVTNELRRAKSDYYVEKFDQYKGDCQRCWGLINGKEKSKKISEIFVDGLKLTTDEDMSNAFNKHFCNVGKSIAESIPISSQSYNIFMQGNYPESFFLSPVSPWEISQIICSMKNKSTNSILCIPIKVWKAISPLISIPLAKIINASFQRGLVADSLKTARVTPILKAGDPSEMGNCHPISSLSVFSKISEKVVHKRLYAYLCKYRI